MKTNNIFSIRLKELRLLKNLSQKLFGEIIGLSMQTVNDMERGRSTTTFEKLVLIADYFDVSVDYLLGRTDNPKVNK